MSVVRLTPHNTNPQSFSLTLSSEINKITSFRRGTVLIRSVGVLYTFSDWDEVVHIYRVSNTSQSPVSAETQFKDTIQYHSISNTVV